MDNAVLNDGGLSQYTRSVLSDGSWAVAQAPVLPSDEEVSVKQGPGPEVWENHRPTIKRLYFDEDKTLKAVMGIMEREYGFKATVKMYKSHIDKWGLRKNCKANEMKAIARKKVDRDAIGKASSIRVGRRQVKIEEVQRYFKRKFNHSLEEWVARVKSPRPATPSDIEVSTPAASIPSPSSNDPRFLDSALVTFPETEFAPSQQKPRSYERTRDPPNPSSDLVRRQSIWMNNNKHRRLSSLGGISPSLEPPQDLLVAERLFSAIKTFLQSSCDRDLRSTNKKGHLVSRERVLGSRPAGRAIFDFQNWCVTATNLLDRRLFVEARQSLCKACEKCENIVKGEDVRTIHTIFDVYFRSARRCYDDAALIVFEHLKSVATMTLSSTHAFSRLITNLLLVNQNIEEVYFTAWKCSHDILEQHLEPFHKKLLYSRLNHIIERGLRSGWPEAETLVRSLLTQYLKLHKGSESRCQGILVTLACILSYQRKFEEAEKVGQEMLQYASHSKSKRTGTIMALRIISTAQYDQDKNDQAEDSVRQCIKLAAKRYGKKHPKTINYSLRLEKWLLSWGRGEEARELAAQRRGILGPAEIEELIE